MKKYLLLLLITSLSVSQNINDYKYAIVPAKFAFLKEVDQYRMNTLTKMFMQKYGFETYLDSEILPSDFASTNCNKVFVEVENSSTMFMTKLRVVLKDCKNNILFTSQEGRSKEKEYKVSYNQALREAFNSFNGLGYKYNGNQITQKSLEMIGEQAQTNAKVRVEKVEVTNENVVVTTSKVSETTIPNSTATAKMVSGQYYAQPITNGFQIIDSEPKVVYKIYKTSTKDFYIATKGTLNGIFFSKNNEYFFEYYEQGKLITEKVSVKF